jgi:hypothetical protein
MYEREAMEKGAVREAEIPREMNNLSCGIEALWKEIEELEARLEPVLGKDETSPSGSGVPVNPNIRLGVPLAMKLADRAAQIDRLVQRLVVLRSQIEL